MYIYAYIHIYIRTYIYIHVHTAHIHTYTFIHCYRYLHCAGGFLNHDDAGNVTPEHIVAKGAPMVAFVANKVCLILCRVYIYIYV